MKELNQYLTPETDTFVSRQIPNDPIGQHDWVELCKDLERRLAACQDALKGLHNACNRQALVTGNESIAVIVKRIAAEKTLALTSKK